VFSVRSYVNRNTYILRYGLRYTSSRGIWLHGFTSSDWMGSVVDWKSTSGYCFSVDLAMISWSSRKQGSVAQSTAEAEYISEPHYSNRITYNNVFCLYSVLGYGSMFLVGLGYHSWTQTENIYVSTLLVHCTSHPIWICKTMKYYPSTGSISKPIGYSSVKISENMLNNDHMNMFWFTHEIDEGIHYITNVWFDMY